MPSTRIHALQVLPYAVIVILAAINGAGSSSLPATVALVTLLMWRALVDLETKTFFTPLALAAGLATSLLLHLRSALSDKVLDLLQLVIPASLLMAFFVYGSCFTSVLIMRYFDGSRLEETAHNLIFPLVWCIGWSVLCSYHSLGRLIAWTPYKDLEHWRAILPLLGPMGADFVLASLVIAIINIKPRNYKVRQEAPPLIDFVPTERSPLLARTRASDSPQRRRTLYRTLVIASILLCWWIADASSLEIGSPSPNLAPLPVRVACVLPQPNPRTDLFANDDYVLETDIMSARGAKILLWPDGALYLQNGKEKDELFETLHSLAARRHANIEIAYTSRELAGNERLLNMAGMFDVDGRIIYNYTKQALVPIAESYTFTSGKGPVPKARQVHIPQRGRHSGSHQSGRNITLSTAICHDTSFDSLVRQAYPVDLLLVPSSVFSDRIAWERIQHMRMQALALRMAILVCDGTHQGISAFIERNGEIRYWQQGKGSFEVSTNWLHGGSSFYGRYGDFGGICLLIATLIGCGVLELSIRGAADYIKGLYREFRQVVRQRISNFWQSGPPGAGALTHRESLI